MLAVDARAFDLSPALARYAEHGYARLGPVLEGTARAALGARVDDIMNARVRHEGLFFQRDSATGRYEDLAFKEGFRGPSLDYRKIEKLEVDPLFRAWLSNALFERAARAVIEGPVSLYRAVLFTKSAAGGTALPWHQDDGRFWGIDRAPQLQIWTALDDAPAESGCLEVLPGSHLRGLASPQGGVVIESALVAARAEENALALPAAAGEAILIHPHLWHRSGVNRTGRRRSAFTVCLMSAATRCLRKKRAPRQFPVVFA